MSGIKPLLGNMCFVFVELQTDSVRNPAETTQGCPTVATTGNYRVLQVMCRFAIEGMSTVFVLSVWTSDIQTCLPRITVILVT